MYKPRPLLDEMPRIIKEKIVEKLEWRDRLRLRQSSPAFLKAVDSSPIHLDRLHICFCKYSVDVFFRQYREAPTHCCQTVYTKSSRSFREQSDSEFLDKVINDLMILLRNPKLTIARLSISFGIPRYGVAATIRHFKTRVWRYFFTRRSSEINYPLFFEKLTARLDIYFGGSNRKLNVIHYSAFAADPNDDLTYWLKYLDPSILGRIQIESVEHCQKYTNLVHVGVLNNRLVEEMLNSATWIGLEHVDILNYSVSLKVSDIWHLYHFDGILTDITENDVKLLVKRLLLSDHEFSFNITTPEMSVTSILQTLGRSFHDSHSTWRRYEMGQIDAHLIFKKESGEHRFCIFCEARDPEIDEVDFIR